jgi:alkanesulfonate monooxygenase SsuD/methylene tetrahydromethanopterin reductase-like flavin-dependent oxidoreductase (luciferase family)
MMADWHGVDPAGPESRMEELLPLLRRLWRLHEGPVRHDGRFYHVDVAPTAEMTAPVRTGIALFTAGVNTRMVQVAGRVADGFIGGRR